MHGLEKGVEYLFCDSGREYINKGPLFFWMYVFYLSKFYELIDTVLIVLRKVRLIFVLLNPVTPKIFLLRTQDHPLPPLTPLSLSLPHS